MRQNELRGQSRLHRLADDSRLKRFSATGSDSHLAPLEKWLSPLPLVLSRRLERATQQVRGDEALALNAQIRRELGRRDPTLTRLLDGLFCKSAV
jgi:hypothetical protein